MDHDLSRANRLIELRERERNAEAVELVRANAIEQALAVEEQKALATLVQAESERRKLTEKSMPAADYLAQDDWLETLAIQHALVRRKLLQARATVRRAQGRVNAAQTRLKQVELLRERLLLSKRTRLLRIERRAEDEIAQRMFTSVEKEQQ